MYKRDIYNRFSGHCVYCGKRIEFDDMTIDHILLQSKGGKNTVENIVLACKLCNNQMADQTTLDAYVTTPKFGKFIAEIEAIGQLNWRSFSSIVGTMLRNLLLILVSFCCIACAHANRQSEGDMNNSTQVQVSNPISTPISKKVEYDGFWFRYVVFPPGDVKMAWKDESGNILHSQEALQSLLLSKGDTLLVAMNGGMYTGTYEPCGLYVENGTVLHSLNKNFSGTGNFTLPFGQTKTNGVFLITADSKAKVVFSKDYTASLKPYYATQSGPVLVYNNTVNPMFGEKTTNILPRNGIGVNTDGNVVMVFSGSTNFYTLAKFFRDELMCPNALYLDGVVSRMFVLNEQANPWNIDLGVLIYASK